jgi:hypothetical protein
MTDCGKCPIQNLGFKGGPLCSVCAVCKSPPQEPCEHCKGLRGTK